METHIAQMETHIACRNASLAKEINILYRVIDAIQEVGYDPRPFDSKLSRAKSDLVSYTFLEEQIEGLIKCLAEKGIRI